MDLSATRAIVVALLALGLGAIPVMGDPDPPDWTVNETAYDYDGTITSAVFSDEIQIGGESDLLAAFVGNDCRGVAEAWRTPLDTYIFLLSVYSNEASGEFLAFRYYDADADLIYRIDDSVGFYPDMIVGSLPSPRRLDMVPYSPPSGWEVDQSAFDYDGTVTVTLHLESEAVLTEVTSVGTDGDFMAAFSGGECRGCAEAWETPAGDFLFLLTVYSNETSGDSLIFAYYEYFADCTTSVIGKIGFAPDMILGSLPDPLVMYLTERCHTRPASWGSIKVMYR